MDDATLADHLVRYHQQQSDRDSVSAAAIDRAVQRDLQWRAASAEHHILLRDHALYPPLLRAIADPPEVLFVAGQCASLHSALLAMVGSRRPSAAGRRLAQRLAAEVCQEGLGICSGMAFGIDKASHLGALEAGGHTVAVLGSGLLRLYPEAHAELAARIQSSGALVSEFPLDAAPLPWRFPQRNRVVTGLSLGVLVVEAALRSGSLVSARCALEQGREVFAVPGQVDNPQVRGCHWLLRQGAVLTESVADIMAELLPSYAAKGAGVDEDETVVRREQPALDPDARVVWTALGTDRINLDTLLTETGLAPGALMAALAVLDLQGLVTQQGPWYSRT